MTLARMRTIKGCCEQLKLDDPDTALKKHAIRQLVLQKKIKFVKAGNKYLINYDDLLNYLSNPKPSIEESTSNTEYGKIRPVKADK